MENCTNKRVQKNDGARHRQQLKVFHISIKLSSVFTARPRVRLLKWHRIVVVVDEKTSCVCETLDISKTSSARAA